MGAGKIDPKKVKKFLDEYDKLCRKHSLKLVYINHVGKLEKDVYEPEAIATSDGSAFLEISKLTK